MNIKKLKRGCDSHGQSSTHVNVRIPDEIFRKIDEASKKHGVSRSSVIVSMLSSIKINEIKAVISE